MSKPTDSDRSRFSEVGTAAWRSLMVIVITVVLVVTVAGLGFLVYTERITPEPFLLLVGIVVGFILGRLDAIL